MRIPRLAVTLCRSVLEQNWHLRLPRSISSLSHSRRPIASIYHSYGLGDGSRGVSAREKGVGARGVARGFSSCTRRNEEWEDDYSLPPTLSLAAYKPKVSSLLLVKYIKLTHFLNSLSLALRYHTIRIPYDSQYRI